MINKNNSSLIVISDDNYSYLIQVDKDTNLASFYNQILLKFPNLDSMKLFYYEGYSHNKLYITNENEYITANKKCIEYFYTCSDNSNIDDTNKIDYLKYHSVIVFSPIKKLNKQANNEKRKEMQIKNDDIQIKHFNSNGIINNNNNFNMMNNNVDFNMNFNNSMMMNNNLNMMINNFNMMNVNNNNFPMNNINNMNMFMNNGMINNSMMMNNNPMMMNSNIMFNNNPMMMNNNMGNFNMNNFNNQRMFLNCVNNLMNTNPMMYYNIMSQLNPLALQNFVNTCTLNNNIQQQNQQQFSQRNSFDNIHSKPQILVPEYETIDTESNPMNKYIENAINFGHCVRQLITEEKNSNPDKFIDIENTLKHHGLLSTSNPSANDYKYILCLIGKILINKNIKVGIYKDNQDKDRIDLCSIQFIFSGLINKKKYTIFFSNEIDEGTSIGIIYDLAERKTFIDEWKTKISQKINVAKNLIILTNPRIREGTLIMDLAFNPNIGSINENILIKELKKIGLIQVDPRPLLEGCRLSTNLFDPNFSKFYKNVLPNLKRGGEDYIQPSNWTAYGINVSGKYDFGNDIWLGNSNKRG